MLLIPSICCFYLGVYGGWESSSNSSIIINNNNSSSSSHHLEKVSLCMIFSVYRLLYDINNGTEREKALEKNEKSDTRREEK